MPKSSFIYNGKSSETSFCVPDAEPLFFISKQNLRCGLGGFSYNLLCYTPFIWELLEYTVF